MPEHDEPLPAPEWTPPEPRQIPALRESLAEQMRNPNEHANLAVMLSDGQGTVNPLPGDPSRSAAMLLNDERDRLLAAHLFSVTNDMTELARRAGAQLPNWEVRRSDVPSTAGFMCFGGPIGSYVSEHERRTVEIVAASWRPTRFSGEEDSNLWLTFWSATDFDAIADKLTAQGWPRRNVRSLARKARADLCWDNESVLVYDTDEAVLHSNWPEPMPVDARKVNMATETTTPWINVVRAAWLLMRQEKMTETTEEPLPRTVRRRAERQGFDASSVRVVHLHRTRHRPDSSDSGGEGSKHTVQYPVTGHWRQQPYKSRGTVERIWIDEHWRGPEDAPVKVSKNWKVNVLDEPPKN